jgi:hypothetical protein
MEQTNARTIRRGMSYIKRDHGFLLERGYEIHAVENVDLGWQVTLRRANLLIRIFRSRGEEYVLFQAATQPPDEFTDMEIILSVIAGEKIPVSSENPAKDLQKYLDRIEAYFAGEYLRDPDGLRVAREEHYASLRQEQQVLLDEQILLEEAIHPKEEKIIPILYYPLLGIILLLLFIVLTTLYMAVLDRLFAAFSWDPDSYTMFMGIAAVLLSIATMLLFRRRRQRS